MDDLVKDYLISFYSKQLLMHGDRPEAIRWTPMGQMLRYSLFSGLCGGLNGKSILDYGCGKGDFYAYLKDMGLNIRYSGFDINPDLIALAKSKFPHADFRVFDIEESPLIEDFDYICLFGIFNNNVEGMSDTMRNIILRLFERTRIALLFDALSSSAKEKSGDLHYTDEDELIYYLKKNVTADIRLIKNRIPDGFAVFLSKNQPVCKS